jgi:hypothetical protein
LCAALVEAFRAGNAPLVSGLGLAIARVAVEPGGAFGRPLTSGTLLPFDAVPADAREHLDLLEDVVPLERLEAIWDGAALAPDEEAFVLDARALSILGENPDPCAYPAWLLSAVPHPDGGEVYVIVTATGTRQTGVRASFAGAWATPHEAMAALREAGYVSDEDYRVRSVRPGRGDRVH